MHSYWQFTGAFIFKGQATCDDLTPRPLKVKVLCYIKMSATTHKFWKSESWNWLLVHIMTKMPHFSWALHVVHAGLLQNTWKRKQGLCRNLKLVLERSFAFICPKNFVIYMIF